jgi:signal transduction histidine kinase
VSLAIAPGTGAVTTYRATSDTAAALDLAAGLGLLIAGVATSRARPHSPVGALATLAGVAWFATDWEGWVGGPDLVRVAGMAIAPFTLALIGHLVLVSHGLVRGATRAAIAALYAVAAIAGIGGLFVHDPFLDVDCWRTCGGNPLVLHADPALASALVTTDRAWAVVAGLALVAVCAARLVRGPAPARRLRWFVQVPGAAVGAAWAVSGVVLLLGPPEGPEVPADVAAFDARAAALVALAAGLGLQVREAYRRRLAVARLAVAPAPGRLRSALAAALDDPGLDIGYRVGDSPRYVDADGRTLEDPQRSPGRVATPVVRGGRELAVVVHDAVSLDPAELEREIGAAALLAIENESLGAELRAQLHDLRASRERIVETGDAQRRALERDLHDGAQQRLLALSYDLRVAAAAARDPDLRLLLERAGAKAQDALAELRDLAHGISPAILHDAGLAAAIATLADTAPVAVELEEIHRDRLTPAVETAAYLTVAEAVAGCAQKGGTYARVAVRRTAEDLVIDVTGDGAPDTNELAVADRLATLGAHVTSAGDHLRVVIPCA